MNYGSIAILLFIVMATTAAIADDTLSFKIKTKRDNDRIEVKA